MASTWFAASDAVRDHGAGIAPDAEIHDREGRPIRICEGQPLGKLFG